jgi:hypothetical protein
VRVTKNISHCIESDKGVYGTYKRERVKEKRPILVKKTHGPTELWPNSMADFPVHKNI